LSQISGVDAASVSTLARAFLAGNTGDVGWREAYDVFHRLPVVEVGPQQWLVAGHRHVNQLLENAGSALSAVYPATLPPALNELFLALLPYEHGPNHKRLRTIGQSLFSRSTFGCLRRHVADLVERQALPRAFSSEGCDVASELASRVPPLVSSVLLDVAVEDRDAVARCAVTMYRQLGRYDQRPEDLASADAAVNELRTYVLRRSSACSETAALGGIGNRLVALRRDGTIDESELLNFFALFLFTGMDTLNNAVANSVWFLGRRPDIFKTLHADPTLSRLALEEVLRLWGPIRMCVRVLENEVGLDDQLLPAGSTVFLVVHAANRDSRHFQHAHAYSLGRKEGQSLAFGTGPHDCMGAAVGKAVGSTVFEVLSTRCSQLRSTPSEADAQFIRSIPILGIDSPRIYAVPAADGSRS
jgi:cytochrome P450